VLKTCEFDVGVALATNGQPGEMTQLLNTIGINLHLTFPRQQQLRNDNSHEIDPCCKSFQPVRRVGVKSFSKR